STVFGPQLRKGRWIREVRSAVGQRLADLFINHVDVFALRILKRPIPVRVVLQMYCQRETERIGAIGIARMDGTAMMKADLALPEHDGDAYDLLRSASFEVRLRPLEIRVVEEPQVVHPRPFVTPVDDDERPSRLVAVVKRDPGGEHVVRSAI